MNFKFEGQVFETSTLRKFETGDSWIPFIYLTPDETAVFYATVDAENSVEIRRASNADIRRLAARYKFDVLRRAQRYPAGRSNRTSGHSSNAFSPNRETRQGMCDPAKHTAPAPFHFP